MRKSRFSADKTRSNCYVARGFVLFENRIAAGGDLGGFARRRRECHWMSLNVTPEKIVSTSRAVETDARLQLSGDRFAFGEFQFFVAVPDRQAIALAKRVGDRTLLD